MASLVLPLFPLPDVTFFPGTMLPLHVFEARYRALVMDVLARDRRLCVVQLRPGHTATYARKPPLYTVAGAGEIVNWERLSNGRYNILVRGDRRVRLAREHPSDTLYRIALGEALEDTVPARPLGAEVERVRVACRRLLALLKRPSDLLDGALAEGQRPGLIADRIASAVVPEAAVRQRILETLDVGERLARVGAALEMVVSELSEGRGAS